MRMRAIVMTGTVLWAGWMGVADAGTLCTTSKGRVTYRDTCKKKETAITAAEIGAVGPQGPKGDTGAAGENATPYWAVVRGDGTLARGSHVTSAGTAEGAYEVIFDRDVTGCAYVATVGLAGSESSAAPAVATVVGRSEEPNGVYVVTTLLNGDPSTEGFHLMVSCP